MSSRLQYCSALLAAALLAAAICSVHGKQASSIGYQQDNDYSLPPLPHSAACALAGGWCPSEPAEQPQWLAGLNESGNSSSRVPHKPLWPLAPRDWLGIGAAGLALLLAASGGIGGGAILVPLYLMVLGFSTAGAVALSNITIVGGTLANLCFNVVRRHPLAPQRPLIDWDLALLMEPSTILGAIFGGYVNKVLPGWLTTVSMAVLLTYITYKMVRKAADLYSKERRSLTQSLRRLADVDAEGGDLVASLRTPLLGSLATLPGSGSSTDGSPALPRLVLSPPDSTHVSPAVPLMLRPDSARSGGTADEETGGAAGGAAATGAAAALMVAQAEEGLLPRASSQPLTIGAPQGSTPLPMLTPVLDPPETRLSSAEQQKLLLAAAAVQDGGAPAAEGLGEAAAGQGRTWPYKGQQAGPSGGGKAQAKGWGRPHLPWGKLGVLVALLAGVVFSDLAKMHAACPSLSYWVRATVMVPITVAALLAVRAYLLHKATSQRAAGYHLLEGDVEWNTRTTLFYPIVCSAAGLCAGVFGVGGGIIKGPLMLEMGVLPEVAAATSATMILFTSMSASVVFISFGAVQWDYGVVVLFTGITCTAIGQLLVLWVNRHLQSRSLLVIIMAAVLGISCVALAVQGGGATVAAARAGTLWDFHGICGSAAL